ncbi:SIMPL domain-containing protein [Salibacterium lacus]|uniref:SIMPL domain-containing protein n=1 Tax=Salibacterium lacus TaxID=1898109 RepID=A0ABW5T281_9BACI
MLKTRMKKAAGAVAALTAGGFLYAAAFSTAPVETAEAASSESSMQTGTIVVQGESSVSVEPDTAQLRLGAEVTDTSASTAQQQVSERMSAIREAINQYDIPEENIETSYFGVNTDHAAEGGEEQFRARHILSVEFSKIDQVGQLLDDAAAAGANQIQQTRFTLQDQTEYEQQALRQAVENTSAKAEAMAAGAGKSSGAVLQISENGAQVDLPAGNYAREESQSAADNSTSIEPGQVDITQRVSVVYELD